MPHLPPRITKDGHDIDSVDSWFDFAPPKGGKKQWRDGRSAKEIAKAWFPVPGPACVPPELESLLRSHPDIVGAYFTHGTPEVKIRLDDFRGETRNADLVLIATRGAEEVLFTVEAKADEPFDMTVGEKHNCPKKDSNIPKRVEHLCRALFGATPAERPELKGLRYQLLNATAATLIAAQERGIGKAVFVIHEFVTTDDRKMQANHNALVDFVRELSRSTIRSFGVGAIVGPLSIPGGPHVPAHIPLYLGKIRGGLPCPR